jgi:hypothetical protein
MAALTRMPASDYPAPPRSFLDGLRYCRNPLLVMHHFRERRNRSTFIATVTGAAETEAKRVIDECERDREFHALIMQKREEYLGHGPSGTDWMYLVQDWGSQFFPFFIHYAMVRLRKPEIVVETGGTPGNSSAFILRAMQRNGRGRLVTLDLPSLGMMKEIGTEQEKVWYANMPTNLPPGWIVPDALKDRHEQVLGDARETLPDVLRRYPAVDIFIHDSDHSTGHMRWEFLRAWPAVKPGGILYSDDVNLNSAFDEFTREVSQPGIRYDVFGAIKKPGAG